MITHYPCVYYRLFSTRRTSHITGHVLYNLYLYDYILIRVAKYLCISSFKN